VTFLFGINSASLQDLLFYMTTNEKIRSLDYSLAIIKMLFWRRTFVSLSVNELTAMMDQGAPWLTFGVNTLRDYLQDPTVDFKSAAPVVLNFIGRLYQRGNCELGVALELVEYLVEPLLRHKDCPSGWLSDCISRLWAVLGLGSDNREESLGAAHSVYRAAERAKHPMKSVTMKTTVLYCMTMPQFIAGVLNNEPPPLKEHVRDDKSRPTPDDASVITSEENPDHRFPAL
jgi:hypothetical protein